MAVYRLAPTAEADIVDLLDHTYSTFGAIARQRYERLVLTALRDVAANPQRVGSVARPEFGDGVRCYHLRYSRERARTKYGIVFRPRHLLVYRHVRADLVGVGRILHDAMEVERHLPKEFGDE
jgi:toxin ParE1/3/4